VKTHGVTHWDPDTCYGCRIKTIQFSTPAFIPHYSHAIGRYVSSDQDFRDGLKEAAERNSLTTGVEHDYEPRYPGDKETIPYSAADQIIDDRAKILTDKAAQ
jgi:hypothetical protein